MTPCTSSACPVATGADRASGGAILMELVIAIPLFVVLLGGTMWVGDIILAKQKLAIADRFAAWSGGNRHRPDKASIKDDIQKLFFPNAKVGDQRVDRVQYASEPLKNWSSIFESFLFSRMCC